LIVIFILGSRFSPAVREPLLLIGYLVLIVSEMLQIVIVRRITRHQSA
jgi:hypothetical protein